MERFLETRYKLTDRLVETTRNFRRKLGRWIIGQQDIQLDIPPEMHLRTYLEEQIDEIWREEHMSKYYGEEDSE